jgi:purine-binding chemotaxis protein CheW
MKETPKNPVPQQGKAVDWDRLRRRLEAARATLEQELTPDRERDILRKRAKALSQKPQEEMGTEAGLDFLEFRLNYETYAIGMDWVTETCPLKDLTPLPGTPPFVAGIINLRGRIFSVVDIRRFFDLPEKGLTNLNRVIILQGEDMEFGILADEILGTRSVTLAEIQPPLPTLTGIREEYLSGVTRDRTAILDGARLLGDRNLVVVDRIAD